MSRRAPLKAIEFFSGIGAFAQAAREFDLEVIAAFDQNESANIVYAHNFGWQPSHRNLDSIQKCDLPDADVW
ncbi:MAG: DNA cytosine methyltransferase, partial [Terriglobales bacterium]